MIAFFHDMFGTIRTRIHSEKPLSRLQKRCDASFSSECKTISSLFTKIAQRLSALHWADAEADLLAIISGSAPASTQSTTQTYSTSEAQCLMAYFHASREHTAQTNKDLVCMRTEVLMTGGRGEDIAAPDHLSQAKGHLCRCPSMYTYQFSESCASQ